MINKLNLDIKKNMYLLKAIKIENYVHTPYTPAISGILQHTDNKHLYKGKI